MGASRFENPYAQFRPSLGGGWILRLSDEGWKLLNEERITSHEKFSVYALAIIEALRNDKVVSNVGLRRNMLKECGMSPGAAEWREATRSVLKIFGINID